MSLGDCPRRHQGEVERHKMAHQPTDHDDFGDLINWDACDCGHGHDCDLDKDDDSTFGDDYSNTMCPYTQCCPSAKRVAEDCEAQSLICQTRGCEHPKLHIDPRDLCCSSQHCTDQHDSVTATASRPSKRRRLSPEVSKPHPSENSDSALNFSEVAFEKFCNGCGDDLEVSSCTSPCPVPCTEEDDCDADDKCYDPLCSGQAGCDHPCVSPECTKLTCPGDPCYCNQCGFPPCINGDPSNECHTAHSAPTASGTIYCYDDVNCHFQNNYRGNDSNFPHSQVETYPCYVESHNDITTCNHAGQTVLSSGLGTPALSTSHYSSLESGYTTHSSPIQSASNIQNGTMVSPTAYEFSKMSLQQTPGYQSSSQFNVGGYGSSHLDLLSNALSVQGNTALLAGGAQSLYNFPGTWAVPNHHLSSYLIQNQPPATKLDYLASAVQAEVFKPEPESLVAAGLDFRPTTSASTESVGDCTCKWLLGHNMPCNQLFETPEALHKHVKTAHVDNCARCICQWEGCEAGDKDYKQRSKLSRHLLGHAKYRPYPCSHKGCDKTFATNQAKDNHERTHTGDRPFVCPTCGYTTTTHTQLQTHISAIHLNHKPHKCRFCDFSCADSSNLSKHERTHQTLRPYRCPYPGCTFKPDCRWENLKRHFRRTQHCPELLQEDSEECKKYREGVRQEMDEWHRRHDSGIIGGRRKVSKSEPLA